MASESSPSTEKLDEYTKVRKDSPESGSSTGKLRVIASSLLRLGDDKRAVVCVPSSSEATELIDMVEQLGDTDMREESFGRILILTQQSKLYKSARQLSIDSLSIVHSSVLLFWRQYLNEAIKSLDSYQEPYEYHLKKCESLLFVEFFKRNVSSAFKYVESCFAFIQRLPLGTFSGIDVNDIAQLMDHMRDVKACLTKKIDNDALSFVLGICSPPEKIPVYYCEGVDAATDLKEKMNTCLQTMKAIKSSLKLKEFQIRDEIKEYLLSKSKIVICTASSCSQMGTILSQLNQSNAHAIDLVIFDDALMIQSSDIETILSFPAVRNTVLFSEITGQENMDFKELPSIRTRHQFTKQYEFYKDKKKCLMDSKLEPSLAPFGWVGIPKNMLAPVRNQGNTDTCTFHSTLAATETHYKLEASVDKPPRKFTIELCVEDMERLYKTHTGKELGSEISDKEKGRSRVEHALAILKQEGVIGKSRSTAEKVPVAFRISSFEKYSFHDFAKICKLLEECKVMVGSFRLSRNYFNLNPRQPYIYDDKEPIINSKSKLPCSHAILLVGFLPDKLSNKEKLAEGGCKVEHMSKNLVYQNSYGKLFGESDGFGVVVPSSVQRFYLPIL